MQIVRGSAEKHPEDRNYDAGAAEMISPMGASRRNSSVRHSAPTPPLAPTDIQVDSER
jgi:hypothetical protein